MIWFKYLLFKARERRAFRVELAGDLRCSGDSSLGFVKRGLIWDLGVRWILLVGYVF